MELHPEPKMNSALQNWNALLNSFAEDYGVVVAIGLVLVAINFYGKEPESQIAIISLATFTPLLILQGHMNRRRRLRIQALETKIELIEKQIKVAPEP